MFAELDDTDVLASIKVWTSHPDRILSRLCSDLLNRSLFRVEIQNNPFDEERVKDLRMKAMKKFDLSEEDVKYFVQSDQVINKAYVADNYNINMLMSNGRLVDVAEASDLLNIQSLSKTVTKYFVWYPKELEA